MATAAELAILLSAKDEASGVMRGVGGAAGKMGKVVAAGAAIGAAAIIGLGAAALKIGGDFQKSFNTIRVGTGATGDDLEGLKEDFKATFAAIPTDMATASQAIADLNTLTGATGPVLQRMAKGVLEASRVLGEDGVANAKAFGMAMQQWQVPAEMAPVILDEIFQATQLTGQSFGKLTGLLNTYGSVLQNAGFETFEATLIFGRLEAAGISVSRVMPGLNKAFRDWADEGLNSREELERVVLQIEKAEDASKALAIATGIFGAEGAQRMTTAIRNGSFVMDDFGLVAEQASGIIEDTARATETMGDKFKRLGNQVQVAIEPAATAILDLAERGVGGLVNFMQGALPSINRFAALVQQAVGGDVGGALSGLGEMLSPLAITIRTKLTEWGKAFIGWAATVLEGLPAKLEAIGTAIATFIEEKGPIFLERLAGEWIPAFLAWITQAVIDMAPKLASFLIAVGQWVATDGVPTFVRLGGALGAGLLRGILTALQNAGPAIVKAATPSFSLPPGLLPDIKLPGQAHGGITQQPGLSLVGEKGPELLSLPRGAVVSPLPTGGMGGGGGLTIAGPLVGQVILQGEADEDRFVAKMQEMLESGLAQALGQSSRFPHGLVKSA